MIQLEHHQPEWATEFQELRNEIQNLFGKVVQKIEHFGSTSISGIMAKPIIDMIGTVTSLTFIDEKLNALPLHMRNLGENGVAKRRYIVISNREGAIIAHLHLFEANSKDYHDRIIFRKYLQAHKEVVSRYEELKLALAAKFAHDPVNYWQGKAEFVKSILAQATSPIEIRIAETSDARALITLYLELTEDTNVYVDPRYLQQLKDNKTNRIYVAEFGGEVVGTIFVTICLDPMYGNQPFAVFENFIVTSEYRGQGIGKHLISKAEDFCREARCTKTMFLSSRRREDAHMFFTKSGYDGEIKRGFVKYLNRR